MNNNQIRDTRTHNHVTALASSVTAFLVGVCGIALVLNPFVPQTNLALGFITPGLSDRRAATLNTALPQTNSANNNAGCVTGTKTNVGYNLFRWGENRTCADKQPIADAPVAYPPTAPAQFERTVKTIKRGPQAPV